MEGTLNSLRPELNIYVTQDANAPKRRNEGEIPYGQYWVAFKQKLISTIVHCLNSIMPRLWINLSIAGKTPEITIYCPDHKVHDRLSN
jgi:hypothetical protein